MISGPNSVKFRYGSNGIPQKIREENPPKQIGLDSLVDYIMRVESSLELNTKKHTNSSVQRVVIDDHETKTN